jgi:hypothetical protein
MPFNFWRAVGWAQHMVADISVHVVAQHGSDTRSFDVSGHGSNVYQAVSRENWEVALDRAVKDFSNNFKQAMAAQDSSATNTGDQQQSP